METRRRLAGAWRWLFLVALTACPGLAEDWPTALHDNQRTGVTAEEVRPPLAARWAFRSPFPPAAGWAPEANGYGARKNKPNVSHDDAFRAIAVGDAAYFCSSAENCLYALDAGTGEVRWRFFTDAAPRLAPVFWKGRLFFGADDGVFRCLDAATGKLVWQVRAALTDQQMLGYGRFSSLWPIRAAGIVEDGIACFSAGLFPSNRIFLYAVNAEDGSIVWRRQVDANHVPQGHIVARGDSLFTPSRTEPARWSKADGARIDFTTPFPDVKNAHEYRFYNGGSDVQVWGGKHVVYGSACILAYDPDKVLKDRYGRPRNGDLVFNWFNARQAAFRGEMAWLATDSHVLAVEQSRLPELAAGECKEFEEAYKRLAIASRLDHMEEHERRLKEHGPDDFRVRFLANGPLKWGKESWEKWPAASEAAFEKMRKKCAWMTPLQATEALIVSGGVLYAGGETAVHALDARTGQKLWSGDTGTRVRGLAAANGRLFVSTIDGTLRCFAPGQGVATPATVPGVSHLQLAHGGHVRIEDATPGKIPAPPAAAHLLLEKAGVTRGYCLVLGDGSDRLAGELARASELSVQCLVKRGDEVEPARRRLADAGLYGGRVVVAQCDMRHLPFPPYAFNLVVEAGAVVPVEEVQRVTKPCGGVAARRAAGADGGWAIERRGRLPLSRDWTHNYASPANTYCSEDPLVKGPFGVLWYGEPGPRQRIDRHATPPLPLVVGGVMFTIGYDRVMAYDVYNGACCWQREIEGATREHLPLNTSNLAADEASLFLVAGGRRCLRLDGRTGKTLNAYEPPGKDAFWAWVAREGGFLYGSRAEVDGRGRPSEQTSNAVFALNVETGEQAWMREGQGIDHDGIALGDGRLFLVDRAQTDAERKAAAESTAADSSAPDRKAVDRKGQPIAPDLRKIVALDAASGKLLWERPWNCTDITLDDAVVSEGRVGVACMVKDGVLVVGGTGSLGHPHKEFLAGQFARRALYAFDAATGRPLWGGRKGYRKRPFIVGGCVYAEPFAWDLRTGQRKTVPNPLSGRPQTLDFHRGYIGCGHLLASGGAIFGARQGIAYWNLGEQAGFVPFGGMALACGICAVPANGVFAAPEGRSGCACPTPLLTSVVLYPDPAAAAWGTGFSGGLAEAANFPVKHVSVNLGAPGYRQDAAGNLWIPYPARVDAGPLGKWLPTYQHDQAMCYCDETLAIAGTDTPWVFTSGYCHDKPLRFRLLDAGQPPASYTVKLYFAEPEDAKPGDRAFAVRLQGKEVLKGLDIVAEAGGHRRALVKEFRGVEVKDYLDIALAPAGGSRLKQPILSGFQAVLEAR